MAELYKHLDNIFEKTELILKKHSTLTEDYVRLEEELNELKEKSEANINYIKELEDAINTLKLAKQIPAVNSDKKNEAINPSTKETRLKINKYIKEIDKCIKLLSD